MIQLSRVMEEEREKQIREEVKRKAKECSLISEMKPLNREAYGGGLYGNEKHYSSGDGEKEKLHVTVAVAVARANDTQSADGPVEPSMPPKHKPPPSTGDRDVDITGQVIFSSLYKCIILLLQVFAQCIL
jgi:hypothetical protein